MVDEPMQRLLEYERRRYWLVNGPYEFQGTDELICDFFTAVERAYEAEGIPFDFDAEEVELEELEEYDDDSQIAE